ncbi:MAG: extracellular solute-binding protein [Chelatococcus sp.]|jgi:multiple sugar transport system substrate-binding protein|uniref:extracellular solute-binding protein n=1 Tax=Chelatococcus sp. TaxID=1953771 RepID=UPI0025BCBFB1|nr:extracellular solute-binding protein [Chelatococcus sp.]MBX3538596.1 extracellular solute-binding protein [Chelatococcus sp.]
MKGLQFGFLTLALALSSGGALAETVTVWTFLDPNKSTGRDQALKEIIGSFEKKNPGTTVKVESQVFSELGPKFLMASQIGSAPDVVFINIENLGALVKSGAAADLQSELVSAWPKGAEDDFYMRAAWDAAKSGNARYAVPLFPGTATLFYRKDLFKAAGIDPADLKSWDDLTNAARKLTKDTDGNGTPDIWGLSIPLSVERTGGVTAMLPMIQEGQEQVWQNCKASYDTEAGRRALQVHVDWIQKDKVMSQEAFASNSDDTMEQFIAGRSAMAVGPFARFDATAKAAAWDGAANLGVLPWPTWDGKGSGPQSVTGWFLAASSKSPRKKSAVALIDYMIGPEAARIWSMTGGQVPIRTSVFTDPHFQTPKYEYMRVMQQAWSNWSMVVPTECNNARIDADLNAAVQRVALGSANVSAALKEAEKSYMERQ